MNPLVPEKKNAFVTRDMLHGNMLLLFTLCLVLCISLPILSIVF